ncbi:MAG: dicarboxylate/amino acid:cation symporter [Prolixibacteraceae bacterium]
MQILKLKLHWQILIALVLAVLFGYFMSGQVQYISWMGDLFLRALKMVIIPLILSSIISGITSMGNGSNLGRLGLKTISFYLFTSFLAIITGMVLVNAIRPGVGVDLGFTAQAGEIPVATGRVQDIFLNMIPDNIVAAMAEGQVLGVIIFAVIFGFYIMKLKPEHMNSLKTFFDAFFEVMMKVTLFIIRFTPLGIFGLVSREISLHSDQLGSIAGSIAIYVFTVFTGLVIHMFIILPFLLKWLGRVKPYRHLKNMATPLLTAFSTASSSATLPLTMEAVEHKSGVSNKISSFTLPLGATINMNGTALYECVVVIFIAQVYGIDLSLGDQFLIIITALLTSIGAAGIPMASLVMITIILAAVKLPLEGIGLILAVDRILDMFRTVVNVWGDTCAAVIIARSEGERTNV